VIGKEVMTKKNPSAGTVILTVLGLAATGGVAYLIYKLVTKEPEVQRTTAMLPVQIPAITPAPAPPTTPTPTPAAKPAPQLVWMEPLGRWVNPEDLVIHM
jgi:uncharacterized membrane protein YebE (DUF533 family)